MKHPVSDLDDIVHQRVRLGVLAILAETPRVDFTFLKRTLGVSDGNLSVHLRVLDEAGYVRIEKTFQGRRPKTWVESTEAGLAALTREIRLQREVASRLSSIVAVAEENSSD